MEGRADGRTDVRTTSKQYNPSPNTVGWGIKNNYTPHLKPPKNQKKKKKKEEPPWDDQQSNYWEAPTSSQHCCSVVCLHWVPVFVVSNESQSLRYILVAVRESFLPLVVPHFIPCPRPPPPTPPHTQQQQQQQLKNGKSKNEKNIVEFSHPPLPPTKIKLPI